MKKLKVMIVNCDWRDMFSQSPAEFKDKLERDRLGASLNDFFVFSWARASYRKEGTQLSTRHVATRLDWFRPLLDLVSVFVVPWEVWARKRRFDAVVTYDFGFLPAAWIAAKLSGAQLVMCLNNQPRVYSKTRRFGAIKSLYSALSEMLWKRLPAAYMTINETMKSYIEQLGVPKDQITIFSMNTILREEGYIAAAQKGRIRQKLHLPANAKILLTVARLEAEKNYPRLLELFSKLSSDYVLIALGRGSLLEPLKEQARALGISERVFFEGFVHREHIWDYYADADAFVLLSRAEALGVVLWEAMRLNVPVLVADVPGMLESVGADMARGRVWQEAEGERGFIEKIAFCTSASAERDHMVERAQTWLAIQLSNTVSINDLAIFTHKVQ